jgi:hypothetical protein
MVLECLNVETRKDAWRKAVEGSIREVGYGELNSLWKRLFRDHSHPWSEPFRRLIEKHADGTFYHARTIDQIQFIYCRPEDKGYWFIPGTAIGIMQASALSAMKEIINTKSA